MLKSSQKTFRKALQALDNKIIQSYAGSTIFKRGESYYERGAVENYEMSDTEISLYVEGSDTYTVEIIWTKNGIKTACDCPYEDTCKHIVASLLTIVHDWGQDEWEQISDFTEEEQYAHNKGILEQYLKENSLDKLKELMLEHLPNEFWDRLKKPLIPTQNQAQVFVSSEYNFLLSLSKIEKFLKKTVRTITDFEEDLDNHLQEFRPFWQSHKLQMQTLLMEVLDVIDTKNENGEFYDDSYYEEYYYGELQKEYYLEFIQSLDTDNKIKFLQLIQEVEGKLDTGFSLTDLREETFLALESQEVLVFKDFILKSLELFNRSSSEKIYTLLKPILEENEKLELIAYFAERNHDPFVAIYVEFLQNQPDKTKYHHFLQAKLDSTDYDRFERYLPLAIAEKLPKIEAYMQAFLERDAKVALVFAEQYFPDKVQEYEDFAKSKRVGNYVYYLEQKGRTNEILSLLNRTDSHYQKRFFQTYTEKYPEDARFFWQKYLEENLKNADFSAYNNCVEALVCVKKIVPPDAFAVLLQDIRTGYKRRPKFMELLNKQFKN